MQREFDRLPFLLDSADKALSAARAAQVQEEHVDVHLASAEYFLRLAAELKPRRSRSGSARSVLG